MYLAVLRAHVCRFKPQENDYLNGEGGPAQALLRAFLDTVAGSAPPPAVLYLQGHMNLRHPLHFDIIEIGRGGITLYPIRQIW